MPRTPAWRRWWPRAAAGPTPWAAALATVVLATLVTMLWEGREVPGVRPEAPVAQVAPPAPTPVAPPAVAPAPSPAQADTAAPPSRAPAPAEALRKNTRARDDARTRETRSAAPAPSPAAVDAPAAAAVAPPVTAPPSHPAQPLPAPAPAAAPPPPQAPALARDGAERPPAAAARQAQAEASKMQAARSPWSQVRIELGNRTAVVPREQARELAALLTRMLIAPSEDANSTPAGTLRLELAQGEDETGLLELAEERWRWTPAREPRQPRWLRVDPALSAGVRAEAERLLAR